MAAPRLSLGGIEFPVPFMNAEVLEDHAAALEIWANIQPGKLVLSGPEVAAIVDLTAALARSAGVAMAREQVRRELNTSNLAAAIVAIGYAYIGKEKPTEPAAGEAGGPSSSTGTSSSGT